MRPSSWFEDLARRAKEAAAREQTTLTRLIEEELRLRPSPPASAPEADVATFDGKTGLVPGVDPLSNESLRDAVDA